MSLFLIILAAGDSKRLKSSKPKPFLIANNKTLLEHSISSFKNIKEIKKIIVVYNKKHKKYLNNLNIRNIIKVVGGKSRQKSTFNALKKIKKLKCSKVLIHDSARPYPPEKIIKKIINKLKTYNAVIPVIRVNDATKRINDEIIFKNIDRKNLRFAQTPQGFTFKKIYKKHMDNKNIDLDDDSALFTKDEENVFTINGSKKNLKITDYEDFKLFKSLRQNKVYYGIGFDIHKLSKGKKLYLGGIKIPFPLGLEGHSDADPVIHALIDSILGASRMGDIGQRFSNKNKKYKNIRSTILLKKIINLIKSKNFSINNIDINIISEMKCCECALNIYRVYGG